MKKSYDKPLLQRAIVINIDNNILRQHKAGSSGGAGIDGHLIRDCKKIFYFKYLDKYLVAGKVDLQRLQIFCGEGKKQTGAPGTS
jgi:hypothetical protein